MYRLVYTGIYRYILLQTGIYQFIPVYTQIYTRPQLFFTCVVRPKNGRLLKDKRCHTGPDDILHTLVFFSTFEELNLPMKGPMEDSGVVKLYEPSPTPCLYVAPAENMVGRVPLIPLFLAGNSTLTIPHMFSKQGCRLPIWLRRRCGCGRTTGQQYLRS